MGTYDARTGEVLVFTFKEGPLSTVAHDLKLKVEHFTITTQGTDFHGEFDASSFKVVASMKDGEENPTGLMKSLYPDVIRNITNSVLHPAQYPTITFASTQVTDAAVTGSLTLCGKTREVTGKRETVGRMRVAEFVIDQRDFGITPFSAMLGAMKVKPKITVRISLPF